MGAAPGNLPTSLVHAKAANQSMTYPPTPFQGGMYAPEMEQGPTPADIQEMYAQNKRSLKRL